MKSTDSIEPNCLEPSILPLHPSEQALIQYIRRLKYGTILRLTVHNGLPHIAEEVIQQVKFSDAAWRKGISTGS
jgi:hypothetical protein